MACMTLFAQPIAMATTQLMRIICCEPAAWWRLEESTENKPLRMNWVVVTDSDGARQLRMHWEATEN